MKIALIGAEWLPVPPVRGGAVEQTLYETALAIRNPEISVISPWSKELEDSQFFQPHIFHHINIDQKKAHVKRMLGKRVPPALHHPKTARRFYYLSGLTDALSKINPDFIQVHNRTTFIPYLMQQFPNKPILLYIHNRLGHAGIRLKENSIKKLHRLIFVSAFLKNEFNTYYPHNTVASTVIYNGVDTEKWHPNLKTHPQTQTIRNQHDLKPNRTILFVGRLVNDKGILQLAKAMKVVHQTMPDAKLLILGSSYAKNSQTNSMYIKLQKEISPIDHAVHFTGYIDHNQTPYYYAAADVTVVPSQKPEGFCKVVAESMATGTPVISTRLGALPELVDHQETGILIKKANDTQDLANHITNLLQHPKQRQKMSQNARKKIKTHFTAKARIARLQTFYETLSS